MGNLWTVAVETAYDLYGDADSLEVMPEHLYTWVITSPGWYHVERTHDGEKVPFNLVGFFQKNPLNGWDTFYVHCADALARLNKKTLYVGAGTGRYLDFLADQGIESYGIDVSDSALTLMGQRGITNVEKMDGAAMSFDDDSYPLVYVPRDSWVESVGPLPVTAVAT